MTDTTTQLADLMRSFGRTKVISVRKSELSSMPLGGVNLIMLLENHNGSRSRVRIMLATDAQRDEMERLEKALTSDAEIV